jgi:hypothetical protein
VGLDGALTDEELAGDLGVGEPSASRRWEGMLGTAAAAIGSIAFTLGIAIEPITPRVLSTHLDPLKNPPDRPGLAPRAGRRAPSAPAPDAPALEIPNTPLTRARARADDPWSGASTCRIPAPADRNEIRREQPGSMLRRVKTGKCIFPALNIGIGSESFGDHLIPGCP